VTDRRTRECGFGVDYPFGTIDEATMVLTLDPDFYGDDEDAPKTLRMQYVVCNACEGRGSYVNPSVDGHGIGREEFDEDPDFREAYFGGAYDVTCHECSGKRVVYTVAEDADSPAGTWFARWQAAEIAYASERAYERKYGY